MTGPERVATVPDGHNAQGSPLLLSADADVVEAVLASAAAVKCRVEVCDDVHHAGGRWRAASVVMVGADLAEGVVSAGFSRREGVHLVGREADAVVRWSMPLGASVVVLPDGAGAVTALLASGGSSSSAAALLRLVGATGGLGVSTLAAGLAAAAVPRGWTAAAVECGRHSGGLDLLFGAERAAGWRWGDLAGARGHVGDLRGHLPRVEGVDLVSLGRGCVTVQPDAETAILSSLSRTHRLVVVDAGLGEGAALEHWSTCRTVLVVGADVRSVLSAKRRREVGEFDGVELVVRRSRQRRLAADEVAGALGLPLLGVVGDDKAVPAALEGGDPPPLRGSFGRDCGRLLDALGVPTPDRRGRAA